MATRPEQTPHTRPTNHYQPSPQPFHHQSSRSQPQNKPVPRSPTASLPNTTLNPPAASPPEPTQCTPPATSFPQVPLDCTHNGSGEPGHEERNVLVAQDHQPIPVKPGIGRTWSLEQGTEPCATVDLAPTNMEHHIT